MYKSHYENVPFEIPENWCWTTINDIAFVTKLAGFEYTKYIADNISKNDGIPLFKGKNVLNGEVVYEFESYIPRHISDELFRSQISKKCLLTPYVGTIGNIGIHNKEGIYHLGSNVGKIELFNGLCVNVYEEYVKFYLLSSYGYKELTKQKKATAQESISIEAIREVLIPLPPVAEQLRIVNEIDNKLSYIKEISKDCGKISELIGVAKSKILDLAISGKLVPQDPDDEPAIELLKRINPAFKPCDNSHYENLPQGWTIVGLHSVAEIITGSTPSKLNAEYYNGDVPFYKPNDLDQGRHVRCASEYLSQQGKSISRSIPCNSIAVCCIGSIGKCGFIEKEGVTNQQINTIVPNDAIFPLYMYYFCNSSTFIDELKSLSSAVTISIVNKSKLSTMQIPLPPIAEQKRIISVIEKLYSHLDMITAEL